uniref:Uncharacterized protein n=1 Tax=Stegastes partitus TaxID=144197 RepID=A0A3B5A7S4_9TELE
METHDRCVIVHTHTHTHTDLSSLKWLPIVPRSVKVAFAFDLAVATLAYCVRHVSSAHLNPAVIFGLLTSCQMSALRAFFYVMAQLLGAAAGSAIMDGVRPETTESLGNVCLMGHQ